jgi:hypothetical protein
MEKLNSDIYGEDLAESTTPTEDSFTKSSNSKFGQDNMIISDQNNVKTPWINDTGEINIHKINKRFFLVIIFIISYFIWAKIMTIFMPPNPYDCCGEQISLALFAFIPLALEMALIQHLLNKTTKNSISNTATFRKRSPFRWLTGIPLSLFLAFVIGISLSSILDWVGWYDIENFAFYNINLIGFFFGLFLGITINNFFYFYLSKLFNKDW